METKTYINNLFVPFDIAKNLKDINFKEICLARYEIRQKNLGLINSHLPIEHEIVLIFNEHDYNESILDSSIDWNSSKDLYLSHNIQEIISAPLWDQTIDFIVNKKGLPISLIYKDRFYYGENKYRSIKGNNLYQVRREIIKDSISRLK